MQTMARFNLKVIVAGGGLSLLIIVTSLATNSRILTDLGFLILGVTSLIAGLSPLIVRKKPGQVNFDERDAVIEKNAHFAGYIVLWCAFILTCMIAFRAVGGGRSIGAGILVVTLVVVRTIESLVVMSQYGWRGEGDKS
jgi:hypothetical protein